MSPSEARRNARGFPRRSSFRRTDGRSSGRGLRRRVRQHGGEADEADERRQVTGCLQAAPSARQIWQRKNGRWEVRLKETVSGTLNDQLPTPKFPLHFPVTGGIGLAIVGG
jgi:hypothetical protein